MPQNEKAGVWPVMLTPFTEDGRIDYAAVDALIAFYESAGVAGLFAVCQSSEMFFLSRPERVALAAYVKARAKVPVIASGHVSYAPDDQIEELKAIADTGVDAVILITNRMAEKGATDKRWLNGLDTLLNALPESVPLGLYECPYPYKWMLSDEVLRHCASTGRFRFLKDTCCDLSRIEKRVGLLEGSGLALYNANTATLLSSLRAGVAGFSGVMANFHPELYVWLCEHFVDRPEKADRLQAALTMCSQIERQCYPVNAKAYLRGAGLPMGIATRARSAHEMTPLYFDEVEQLRTLTEWLKDMIR